jgi:hypothetical protein
MSEARPFQGHPGCQEPDGGDPCPQFTDLLEAYDKLRADKAELLAAMKAFATAKGGNEDIEAANAIFRLIAKHEERK